MNIVLVIFDSLRKDCVGVYGPGPWGPVHTPNLDAFASESVVMTRAYPESLPTLPTRRAIYTGRRVYPFHNADFRLKGDFRGAPGWGPIPEDQPTLAEMLQAAGYRTALVSDVYHMFKPSKNYWRGFDQWVFLRGQEMDPYRSGPRLSEAEIDHWFPRQMREQGLGNRRLGQVEEFVQQCVMNYHDRSRETDAFPARVLAEAALWLEQNQGANDFFLTIESFDPHEPWLPPAHYRRMYDPDDGAAEQIISAYGNVSRLDERLVARTRANYYGEVSLCDRWLGYFMESMRVLGLLDSTVIFITSDHGHSIGDRGYMGKRGYPSEPAVYEVPLMVRLPGAEHAGRQSDQVVQHHDISAEILAAAGVARPEAFDGVRFLESAVSGRPGFRDHATVAWGSAVTVVSGDWWLNCKVDGAGALLHDLRQPDPLAKNLAPRHPDVVRELFAAACDDARGGFPDWLVERAGTQADAPGCSDLAVPVGQS
jgi:arylsulfatase A-like enzyme